MPDIESLKKEYNELLAQLSDPELLSDWEKFQELTKRKDLLEKIFNKKDEISEINKKIEENQIIIGADEDSDLVSLAQTEIAQFRDRENKVKTELKSLINEENDDKEEAGSNQKLQGPTAAIVEIRAGTGGQEAALFAGDLYRMYTKYSQLSGWKLKVLDSNPTELGGFKEIIFEITPAQPSGKNGDVFAKMKYEGGVHRVQRIPDTEKAGRVHTSTVSVAILPKPKKTAIRIRPDDLKIDFYNASGPGGQYVNKRHTAVRITHLPTGLVVTSQTERDQFQNKTNAMSILEAKLLERQIEAANAKLSSERKSQIGQAERAEKIKTYNFPQDRLTDHRTKQSWHNLEKIMSGELEPVIRDLREGLK